MSDKITQISKFTYLRIGGKLCQVKMLFDISIHPEIDEINIAIHQTKDAVNKDGSYVAMAEIIITAI